jgi:tetratricopeptide (TPR) repeat protein
MNRIARRVKAKGGNAATICAAAAALASRGRIDEAIAGYRQALALTPCFARAHTDVANLLCAQGRIEEAIAHLRRAIDCAPDLAEPHNRLGNILKRKGMMAGAAQLYAQAVAIEPACAEARNNLGVALVALRRGAEAVVHFREALRIKPRCLEARLNLASALIDLDAISDARMQLELAWRDRDAVAFPLPRLGMLFAHCGVHERATACFSAHAAQCPGEREAMRVLLAWVGEAAGRALCGPSAHAAENTDAGAPTGEPKRVAA